MSASAGKLAVERLRRNPHFRRDQVLTSLGWQGIAVERHPGTELRRDGFQGQYLRAHPRPVNLACQMAYQKRSQRRIAFKGRPGFRHRHGTYRRFLSGQHVAMISVGKQRSLGEN